MLFLLLFHFRFCRVLPLFKRYGEETFLKVTFSLLEYLLLLFMIFKKCLLLQLWAEHFYGNPSPFAAWVSMEKFGSRLKNISSITHGHAVFTQKIGKRAFPAITTTTVMQECRD
jgi:hypothetical protein